MSIVPESKSLRWLAIQFPYTKDPQDDADRFSNVIHVYASAGADLIDRLQAEVDSLRRRMKDPQSVCPVDPDCKCWHCTEDCSVCFGAPLCDWDDESPCQLVQRPDDVTQDRDPGAGSCS